MRAIAKHAVSFSGLVAFLAASGTASAQERGHGPRWDLKVRSADVPNSCTSTVFRPEMRITNHSVDPRDLSEILVQTYFNSPLGSVQPVHPFTFVTVTDIQGGVTGFAPGEDLVTRVCDELRPGRPQRSRVLPLPRAAAGGRCSSDSPTPRRSPSRKR